MGARRGAGGVSPGNTEKQDPPVTPLPHPGERFLDRVEGARHVGANERLPALAGQPRDRTLPEIAHRMNQEIRPADARGGTPKRRVDPFFLLGVRLERQDLEPAGSGHRAKLRERLAVPPGGQDPRSLPREGKRDGAAQTARPSEDERGPAAEGSRCAGDGCAIHRVCYYSPLRT